jgi:ribonuclease-3
MEFLGDRVLGLTVAELLHERFPDADAGELARRFNTLVRQESLARVAESVDLGRYLRLSRAERDSGGAAKPAILADACEAVIAALYLDGGLPAAQAFVRSQFEPWLDQIASAAKDPKTDLQEWAAARSMTPPAYSVSVQEGPPHQPNFTVTVFLAGFEPATGQGGTKRNAEQSAARALLAQLPKAVLKPPRRARK